VNIMLVITRQIKAARSLIGWEQHQLALNSGVAISTVRRLEGMNGAIGARLRTIDKIRKAFEKAGIEFIGDPNPGVRLRESRE
jgi:transcriptional regulator with XRE-family HTH domain